MMNIQRLVREYYLATWYGAKQRPARFMPTAIRVARARLKHGIGPFPFSLLRLAEVEESGWNGYVIMSLAFEQTLRATIPEEMHGLAHDKILFFEHCLRAGLPTIPVICHVGRTPDPHGRVVERVSDASRLDTLLESAPPRLFVKPITGSHGNDAFLATRRNGHFEFDGREGTATDFFAYLERKCRTGTGYIVQPQVRPHVLMLPLASANGLPTVRVVTAMQAGRPEVLFACLKIPVGTNIGDNFCKGESGNLVAGIDLESGTLTPARGSRRPDWPVMAEVDSHPDSGYRIAGSRLPFWEEIVETALQGQRSLPDFKTIGWDIAATQEGVVLVEANSNYDMYILQVAHRRGLKAELAEKLGISIA